MSDFFKNPIVRGLTEELKRRLKKKVEKSKVVNKTFNFVRFLFFFFFSLIFIFISLVLTYWNEGRINPAKIAKNAIEVSSTTKAENKYNQQFVYSTGILKSKNKIEDNYLKKGNYIFAERKVEMYSWKENKSETKTTINGKKKTKINYSYSKTWQKNPPNSYSFKESKSHFNPTKKIKDKRIIAKNLKLGIYSFNRNSITYPKKEKLELSESTVKKNKLKLLSDEYLFMGKGTIKDPQIGDVRISYNIVSNDMKATIFGKLNIKNNKILPYVSIENKSENNEIILTNKLSLLKGALSFLSHKNEKVKIYGIFRGDKNTAIKKIKSDHSSTTWFLRGFSLWLMFLGFTVILISLKLLFSKLSLIILFVMSLILSFISQTLVIILVNLAKLPLLPVVIIGLILLGVFLLKRKNKAVEFSSQNFKTSSSNKKADFSTRD